MRGEMTVTNEQIVAAAKRAGINIRVLNAGRIEELSLCIAVGPDYYYLDQTEGSALAIVAILEALPRGTILTKGKHFRMYYVLVPECEEIEGDTLTDACLAALVAAWPEVSE